jgi:hypothetical protein
MAKMYGKFDRTHQNSKGWTKAAMRHDEERQIFKELLAETEIENPYEPVDGYCCQFCKDVYSGALGTPEDLIGKEGITYG